MILSLQIFGSKCKLFFVAMVEVKIRTSFEIQVDGGRWLTFPHSLLEEFEGQRYLRFRGTAHQIVALVSQSSFVKNATISNSTKLQELLKLRNAAAAAQHAEGAAGNEDGGEKK